MGTQKNCLNETILLSAQTIFKLMGISSFEYPQHMFWMRNKENRFPMRILIWRPGKGMAMFETFKDS